MSESTPSVTVTIPVNTTTQSIKHAGATAIEVKDHHLYVKKSTGSTGSAKYLAIYAPGHWRDAVVND
nr:hypothetical protein [Micromonospora sp. DSM 115978]